MADYGDQPFGLSDIKLTNMAGTTQVDLPRAQQLRFGERIISGEQRGDDRLQAVAAISEAVEWTLGAGGISLEAYALMTGRTAVETGATPNLVKTLTGSGAQYFPYFKVYGKSIGDDASDDIWFLLYKCKLSQPIRGTLQDATYLVTEATGIAIDDGTNGIFDIVQHEQSTDLPTS